MSLQGFVDRFKTLQENWGYRENNNSHSKYEEITNKKTSLRQFQHLTDYIMRFLEQNGNVFETDVRTMFGVDFYKPGNPFNVTDAALKQYLKDCGPYFKANRAICKQAYTYVKTCPPSSTRCLLQVSLQWMKMIRKYYIRYVKKKKLSIKSFTKLIKSAAISECRSYVNDEFADSLDARSVKEAIQEVQEYDTLTSSGTSDYTSEEDIEVIDLTGTQLRL